MTLFLLMIYIFFGMTFVILIVTRELWLDHNAGDI